MHVHHMDVIAAYVQGDLSTIIYMKQGILLRNSQPKGKKIKYVYWSDHLFRVETIRPRVV